MNITISVRRRSEHTRIIDACVLCYKRPSADSPNPCLPCLVSSPGMLNRLTDSNSPGCWHRPAYNTEIIKKRRTIRRHVLHNHWLGAACSAATAGVDDDNVLVDDRLHHSVDLVVAARRVKDFVFCERAQTSTGRATTNPVNDRL